MTRNSRINRGERQSFMQKLQRRYKYIDRGQARKLWDQWKAGTYIAKAAR